VAFVYYVQVMNYGNVKSCRSPFSSIKEAISIRPNYH